MTQIVMYHILTGPSTGNWNGSYAMLSISVVTDVLRSSQIHKKTLILNGFSSSRIDIVNM